MRRSFRRPAPLVLILLVAAFGPSGAGAAGLTASGYVDRSGEMLPQPWVFSVPLLVYRLAMLAWALWIARALLGWLRWGWGAFTEGGIWRPLPRFGRRPLGAPPAESTGGEAPV